jgi:anti-sigma B factor antagonist
MASVGPSFFTVPDRPPSRPVGSEIGPIVVWLWGEHDISTDTALCLTLARAIAVGRAGVIVDLSGVEFMGASTLGVIARARELLHQGSASLTVRSPSAFVRRVIGVCGLDDLLGAGLEKAADVTGRRSAPEWHCPRPTGQIGARVESADEQAETA